VEGRGRGDPASFHDDILVDDTSTSVFRHLKSTGGRYLNFLKRLALSNLNMIAL
jgi:hypothetical protein